MGLDFGAKRIGVAVSDLLGLTAQGLCVLERKGKKKDVPAIMRIIEDNEIYLIVIGLPKGLGGGRGTLQNEVENFGKLLEAETGVSVEYYDERFTTVQAEKVLISANVSRKKRGRVIDKMAAQLILQGWLDTHPKKNG